MYMTHPRLARVIAASPEPMPGNMRLAEIALRHLRAAGLSDREAALGYEALATYVAGGSSLDADIGAAAPQWQDGVAALDVERFPNAVALAEDLYLDDDAAFRIRSRPDAGRTRGAGSRHGLKRARADHGRMTMWAFRHRSMRALPASDPDAGADLTSRPDSGGPRHRRESTPPHRSRRLVPAAALLGLAAFIAACGGGAGSSGYPPTRPPMPRPRPRPRRPPRRTAAPTSEAGSTSASASILSTDAISTALGEAPTPDCKTSVLTGAGTCVWTAADGSWLKVEDGVSQETPDLDAFTQRMTATLGLDEAVDGMGEAAFLGTSSRGTRIAVFLGEGRVVWVVLNKPGDAATQATQVRDMATALLAGL